MKFLAITITSIVLIGIVTIAFFKISNNEPPIAQVHHAREMLAKAELLKSAEFAQGHYFLAKNYYDSAMVAWANENERFILLRQYGKIEQYAVQSIDNSTLAISATKGAVSKIEAGLGQQIKKIEKKITDFDTKYGSFPISTNDNNILTQSKLQFKMGTLAFENKDFALSKSKLDSAEASISAIFQQYESNLQTYFSNHSTWANWAHNDIAHSKKHKLYFILVDKMARTCSLYKNGKEMYSFNIELGANWIGDKNQQNDNSTPEGQYKIIQKKLNTDTKYHKAFLLNYPNDDDKKRFLENKKKGIVKPTAKIGGLIEVHGHGGKGIDWTNGCISLIDADMDILYKHCPIGTKVTIIGSAKPLKELVQGTTPAITKGANTIQ